MGSKTKAELEAAVAELEERLEALQVAGGAALEGYGAAQLIRWGKAEGVANDAYAMRGAIWEARQRILAETGEPGRVVLMGAAPWHFWANPQWQADLQARGLTHSKALIVEGFEVRYCPSLGDWMVVA